MNAWRARSKALTAWSLRPKPLSHRPSSDGCNIRAAPAVINQGHGGERARPTFDGRRYRPAQRATSGV